jgi:hypothetical protein
MPKGCRRWLSPAGYHLAEARYCPLKRIARQSRHRLPERTGSHVGNRPHRSCDVGVSLKILIYHRESPVIGSAQSNCSVDETTHRLSSNIFVFLPEMARRLHAGAIRELADDRLHSDHQ